MGMSKNLLKDTSVGPTLPGVWDFYPLKITPPSSAGMYLSPRDRRAALLQEDASLTIVSGVMIAPSFLSGASCSTLYFLQ